MKHHQKVAKFFLALFLVVVVLSCQEDVLQEEQVQDQDLLTAQGLADDYLNEHFGGRKNLPSVAVTVFQFDDDVNYYTDSYYEEEEVTFGGSGYIKYKVVREYTITAEVKPGGYIFWYAGTGLSELNGIEFDEEALDHLGGEPTEIYPELLWGIQVPYADEDEKGNNGVKKLKYDILYKNVGYNGDPIRLDPHIRVKEGAE